MSVTLNRIWSEVKDRPVVVVYHSHCADGIASAAAVMDYLDRVHYGASVLYFAINYGADLNQKIRDVVLPHVTKATALFVVDLSLTPSAIDLFSDAAHAVIWVDHHKSSIAAFRHLGYEGTDAELAEPVFLISRNVYSYFGLSSCGAMHTFDLLTDGVEPPPLLRYVDDYDRWVFALPNSKWISAALKIRLNGLNTYKPQGPAFEDEQKGTRDLIVLGRRELMIQDDRVVRESLDNLELEGSVLHRSNMGMVASATKTPLDISLVLSNGQVVKCLGSNTPALMSETGNMLAKPGVPGVVFFLKAEGWVVSLRGHSNCPLDMSMLAKAMNPTGGGHAKAAGFSVPFRNFDGTSFIHA